MSRYPTNNHQVIPPFSLFWINMVHDYWMNRDDKAYINLGGAIGGLFLGMPGEIAGQIIGGTVGEGSVPT